jgi:DNA polymerase-3 subunit gamma/tau
MSSYEVVARRWRPTTFASVVGQRHVTATLATALKRDRVAHAFLFTGVRGVGKTTVARLLARALNCKNRNGAEPCNECDSCTAISSGSSVDVIEIDGASNRGIDEVRSLIGASAYRPAIGPFRIYIIDEVHQLTKEAFNALLKTLEEPPSHVKFIMATTEVHKLPATVLSRCQRYDFRRIGIDEITKQLIHIVATDALEIEADAIALIAREADGSMRDAQSLLEQVVSAAGGKVGAGEAAELLGVAGVGMVAECVEAILRADPAEIVRIVRALRAGGYDAERFLIEVLDLLRQVAVAAAAGVEAIEEQQGESVREAAGKLCKLRSPLDLHRLFQSLMQTATALRRGSMPDLMLEMGLLKAAALESVESVAELVAELRRSGGVPPAPGGSATGSGGPRLSGAGGRSAAVPTTTGTTRAPAGDVPLSKSSVSRQAAQRPEPSPASQGAAASSRTGADATRKDEPAFPLDEPPPAGDEPAGAGVSQAEHEGALWEEFLADISKALGVELFAALSNCEVTLLTDSCLEIRPQMSLFRKRLEQPTILDRIREVAVARFGEGFDVRLARDGEPAQSKGPAISVQRIESERQRRIEKEALDDPTVRKAVEILGGKIEKIQRLDE